MTYSRKLIYAALILSAATLPLASAPAYANEPTLPTAADNTFKPLPIPQRPALIVPPAPAGVTSVTRSQEWSGLVSLQKTLAAKAKCVRSKKCRVSETQIDIWSDQLDSDIEALEDEVYRNYDERKESQFDALYTPQYERRSKLEDTRDTAKDQIRTDLDNDLDQIAAFERVQSNRIRDAYRQLSNGQRATWNGQPVSFNQLNEQSCRAQHPVIQPIEADANDTEAIAWATDCSRIEAEYKAHLAKRPSQKKKKAYKRWEKTFKALAKKKAMCSGESLNQLEARLEAELERLKAIPQKKRNKNWTSDFRSTRDQLELVRLALGKAEALEDWVEERTDNQVEINQREEEYRSCLAGANENSADDWEQETSADLEKQVEDAEDDSRKLAEDNQDDVDRWYERSGDLTSLMEERENLNVDVNANNIRRSEETAVRRLETKSRAYLRAISR